MTATLPEFGILELTAAINRTPFHPGLIGSLDLFDPRPHLADEANFEVRDNALALVPSRPRGAPPSVDTRPTRKLVKAAIPHFPLDATIMADSILGVRAFGSNDQLESMPAAITDRLEGMSRRLDLTLEWLRLGAVKGEIITLADRDTGAPIESVSLFETFGVAPHSDQTWPILPPSGGWTEAYAWKTPVLPLAESVLRLIADELGALPAGGVYAVCGGAFFGAIARAPEVRQTFVGTPDAGWLRSTNYGRRISYGGITFLEYLGRIGSIELVGDNDAHFFPGAAPDLWVEPYAPADYVETVNTPALPRYAKQELMDFGKGVMLQAQMNVLPVNTRPRTLIKATATQAA